MPRSASSGSARAPRSPASPPTSASRPRTSTTFDAGRRRRRRRRGRRPHPLRVGAAPASRTTTRSRRCSSRSRSPRAASTTSSRTCPRIIEHPRGERIVEGVFHQRARSDGNAVGYDTIAASGPHACYLHWTRNDGAVVPGDLILIDAGVEVDSLYTADITRTIPVSGRFTEVQRRVYETVREAADAAFAAAKPGREVPRRCTRPP